MFAIVTHADCLAHDTGPGHPECRERLDAINNHLLMSQLSWVVMSHDAPEATRAQIARVHSEAHIDAISTQIPQSGYSLVDGDTVLSSGSMPAALRAAGAGILAVDLVMRGEANPVFCPVRPPGHHAERNRAMGFCLFNNIAIAAAHALDEYDLKRIAIVDFDVHHGNGTAEIFGAEERIKVFSSFRHPFYPFSGEPPETPNLISVPLSGGTDGAAFREAVSAHFLPALDGFEPELILISAGFDGHLLDDMGGLGLLEADYDWITRAVMGIANRHASGRVVSMLEGGYEPGALGRSVVAHIKALMD